VSSRDVRIVCVRPYRLWFIQCSRPFVSGRNPGQLCRLNVVWKSKVNLYNSSQSVVIFMANASPEPNSQSELNLFPTFLLKRCQMEIMWQTHLCLGYCCSSFTPFCASRMNSFIGFCVSHVDNSSLCLFSFAHIAPHERCLVCHVTRLWQVYLSGKTL
jgi:hypothetical protein